MSSTKRFKRRISGLRKSKRGSVYDKHTAWHVLAAVLSTLRDRLPLGLAVRLGAQLPILSGASITINGTPPLSQRAVGRFTQQNDRSLAQAREASPNSSARSGAGRGCACCVSATVMPHWIASGSRRRSAIYDALHRPRNCAPFAGQLDTGLGTWPLAGLRLAVAELTCLLGQHDRDALADGIGKPCGLADQLLGFAVVS